MADRLTPERRSWNMSRIRSTNTKPELLLRSALHKMGLRFRLHYKGLLGRPDIVLPKHRAVVFVHGCFWHQHRGCIEAVRPKSNQDYWNRKLRANVERDRKNMISLRRGGWVVLRFWECEIERDAHQIGLHIAKRLSYSR